MLDLLKPNKTLLDKTFTVLFWLLIVALWVELMTKAYQWLFAKNVIIFSQWSYGYEFKHPFLVKFYLYCLAAPIGEEIVFRHGPLRMVKAIGKKELYWPVILFTSIVFGWVHSGEFNILIQGAIGLCASIIYLKNNFSLFSAIVFHMLWNLICLLNTPF